MNKRNIKVLQIYKTYTPDTWGGVEQVIKNICTETQALGIEQSLLTVSDIPRQDQMNDLSVLRFKKNFTLASCPFSFDFLRNFKKITSEFDLLHFHYPWPFADLSYVLHRLHQPALVTFHADALKNKCLRQLYAPLQQTFLSKVNCIVATSAPLLKNSIILQKHAAKTQVIPIGIRAQDYPPPHPDLMLNWQKRLGSQFALFVGVLRHYKGLLTLISAAKHTTTPIVIAGAGPLYAQLADLIERNHLTHVHLLGRVSDSDKIALLASCSMVILPSNNRAEAFGVSLLEGMLFKKPLISTELGTGTSYVNQADQTGFVIPPNNPILLAEKINFLSQNKALAVTMGEAAYAWFLKEFQSDIMGQRYFKLYIDLTQ